MQRPENSASLTYHENLVDRLGRPHFVDGPRVYEPIPALLESVQNGETVPEQQAFGAYFDNLSQKDPSYMTQIDKVAQARKQTYPDALVSLPDRRLQLIVPAYREAENISGFLENMKRQFEHTGLGEWGITFVMDHAIPYPEKRGYESSARKQMLSEIEHFLEENPQLRPYIDAVTYTRRQQPESPVLPVGLARKVGEDVLMLERSRSGEKERKPLYFGQVDIDAGNVTEGLIGEILTVLPENDETNPTVVHVRGSVDTPSLQENLHLHPFEMMWEGATSEVSLNTVHNPFTIGRFSVYPAKELAITGGGFAKKLQFPDEDIRHGMQIAWQIPNVDVLEVKGRYSTSPRRELQTMNGLMYMLADNNGSFNVQTLECAALIRMYGDWANNTYRKSLGNVREESGEVSDVLSDPEQFAQAVPEDLVEVMANSFYRFTLFSMYAVDELSRRDDVPEIRDLKNQFLKGEIPYFAVQLKTLDAIRNIARTDPERFETLKPALAGVDAMARSSMQYILESNGISYEIDSDEPLYGILEADMYNQDEDETRDQTPLRAPFRILPDQNGYREYLKKRISA